MSSTVKSIRCGNGAWILVWLLFIALNGGLADLPLSANPPTPAKAAEPAGKIFPMTRIHRIRDERSAEHMAWVFEDHQHHQIQLLTQHDTNSSVSLFSNRQLLARAEPTWQVMWTEGVFMADFNGDRNSDFLVVFSSTACGLVRDTWQLVFFLSDHSGKAYQGKILHSSNWSTNDFLFEDRSGSCHYRHTGLLDLMEAGFKARSVRELDTYFWVHQILEFRDTRLVAIPRKGYPQFVEFNRFGDPTGAMHHFSAKGKEMLAQDLLRQMAPQ